MKSATSTALVLLLSIVIAVVLAPGAQKSFASRAICNSRRARAVRLPFFGRPRPFEALCNFLGASQPPRHSPESCEVVGSRQGCRFEHVERRANSLLPLLSDVVGTAYFRYFKVNLFCDCPLWPEDGMCALEACSVCECEDSEVPPVWRQEEQAGCETLLNKAEEESAVNRTLAADTAEQLLALQGWKGLDNPWLPEADANVEYSYINLLVNPERYTGYAGEHAHRIWGAIYSQNCFKHVHSDACDEESLFFYRVISGVHASISMHLSRQYLLDEAANTWGPNMTEFRLRFAQPERCSHVQNMYFAYLFVLKAVAKAAPALRAVHYVTGTDDDEDLRTKALMDSILSDEALKEVCVLPFDEGRMWRGANGGQLREQLQGHFQNITTIMDCVGCEKCKLWGKLQFLGVASALKVLFASNNCFEPTLQPSEMLQALRLERNEVIALVNLLAKLAQSVAAYRSLSGELMSTDGLQPCFAGDDFIT